MDKNVTNPKECEALWKEINEQASMLNIYDMYRKNSSGTVLSLGNHESKRLGEVIINGEVKKH